MKKYLLVISVFIYLLFSCKLEKQDNKEIKNEKLITKEILEAKPEEKLQQDQSVLKQQSEKKLKLTVVTKQPTEIVVQPPKPLGV